MSYKRFNPTLDKNLDQRRQDHYYQGMEKTEYHKYFDMEYHNYEKKRKEA